METSHSSALAAFHHTVLCFADLPGMLSFSKLFRLCFDICFSNCIIKNTACLFHILLAVNFNHLSTILFYYYVYSESPCLRNEMLRKGWFGLFLGCRNPFIRSLTRNLIPNILLQRNRDGWSPSSQNTAHGGAAEPFPARSTYSGSSGELAPSRICLRNPKQHLPSSRCPQTSRCRTICYINGIFIPSCWICSTVHGID